MEEIDFQDKFVAIKLHFGEPGNLSFLRPNFARAVADEVKRSKISCSCVCYRDNYDENIGVFEVYAEGTTKAKAINVLADELDIDRIVVFGDNLNDLPMFRIADYSVATGNAFAAVKDEASEVT